MPSRSRKQQNQRIREEIAKDNAKRSHPQNTREVIDRFARQYKVPRQRIAGNLRHMAHAERSITIVANKPHSIMY